MESSKKLTDFENEYYFEINNYVVRDKDLIDAKVPKKVLAYEKEAVSDQAKTEEYNKRFDELYAQLQKLRGEIGCD